MEKKRGGKQIGRNTETESKSICAIGTSAVDRVPYLPYRDVLINKVTILQPLSVAVFMLPSCWGGEGHLIS